MFPNIVRTDNALRSLPITLRPRQRGWLESLFLSLEIADVAYTRLRAALATASGGDPIDHSQGWLGATFGDAWSVVDATWQVHELLDRPALTNSRPSPHSPVVQASAFKKAVRHLRGVRNKGQHRDAHGPQAAEAGIPVWGTLRWVTISDPALGVFRSWVLATQVAATEKIEFLNPIGQPILPPLDRIQLHAFQQIVDLSEAVQSLRTLADEWDAVLAPQFDGLPRAVTTVLVAFEGKGDFTPISATIPTPK